jgi:transcriptional regulator with XRE-family HTH domain
MKNSDRLGETVRIRRQGLGLTQRSLARRLGVEAAHVDFIESGRRKPSLKLIGGLADILGLDRQDLLITAHPEAREIIADTKRKKPPDASPSWQRFIGNHQLLASYNVTVGELRVLENLSLLGTVRSAKEFLAILMLIRDIPPNK